MRWNGEGPHRQEPPSNLVDMEGHQVMPVQVLMVQCTIQKQNQVKDVSCLLLLCQEAAAADTPKITPWSKWLF